MKNILLISIFLLSHLMFAQDHVIDLYDSKHVAVNPSYLYYIDTHSVHSIKTITDLKDGSFSTTPGILNLGIFDKPVWLKLKLKNHNSELKKWVLNINFALIDTVILYNYTPEGKTEIIQLGEMFPAHKRYYDNKNIVFPLNLQYDKTHTLFIKVKTDGTVYLPITISSEESMFSAEKRTYLFYGIFYGASILILIYNLLLFFTLGDFIYLLYCLYIVVVVGILSYFNGFISYFDLFYDDRSQLNKVFANIVFIFVITSCWFSYHFLEIKKSSKAFSYVLQGLMALGIFLTALSFFVSYQTTITIASLFYVFTPFVLLYISLYSWIKGNYTARFYTIASTFFLVSVVMMSFRVMGLISGNRFQETLIELGVIIDAVLISLGLADKLRKLGRDKEVAQQNALQAIAEKEKLIIEQNSILENKISNRTEEIIEKNNQLELFSQTIKQQNVLLKEYNENLENQIKERTTEILETNKQLKRKTERLEQFTYIVSHNLRSPVSNLTSLLGFMNEEKLDYENREYFTIIKRTSHQLTNIIEDINILVKLDKTDDIDFVEINLEAILQNIEEKLIIQIESTNCKIIKNLGIKTVSSFPPYLTSILYNLISNAIKYRSPARSIEITIESEVVLDKIIIRVSDNGSGIEAEQLNEIFKLFYKINSDQDGKGMGLFIVKSQVEHLGGTISVSSIPDVGSTFTISLPL